MANDDQLLALAGRISVASVWGTRPLPNVDPVDARELIRRLHVPGQRFERAFSRYWRDVMHLPDGEATQRTTEELAASKKYLEERLRDDCVHAIERTIDDRIVACGVYALRDLDDHDFGRRIVAHLRGHSIHGHDWYQGRVGIGHTTAILDEHASLEALLFTLVSMGTACVDTGYDRLLFFSSDHRLERLYRRFGFEFPRRLVPPGSRHLVGVWDPNDSCNREWLRRGRALFDGVGEAVG